MACPHMPAARVSESEAAGRVVVTQTPLSFPGSGIKASGRALSGKLRAYRRRRAKYRHTVRRDTGIERHDGSPDAPILFE